jgi:drug/metabolite transporter (DMT)-like permease
MTLSRAETAAGSPRRSAPAAVEPTQSHSWRGFFYIAAATLCWGAAATAGKALFSGRLFSGHAFVSPLVLTQTRTTFAVLVLLLFLVVRYGIGFFRISGRDLLLSLLVGTLGLAGSNFFYYFAIEKSTVAIAITLQYTAPIWVLLTMVLAGRERATAGRFGAVLLAVIGCALTIGLFHSGLSAGRIGIIAALLASFSYAFYNIAAQSLVTRNHQFKIMAYSLLGAAVLWAILNPPWRFAAQNYSAAQWGFLFLFSCLSMLLPYFFYFTGLKYLDPTRAVLASCLEPVFAILFAAMFVHEGLRWSQVLGITAVLGAVVMVQLHERTITLKD